MTILLQVWQSKCVPVNERMNKHAQHLKCSSLRFPYTTVNREGGQDKTQL